MNKRLLSIFLALCMIVTMLPVPAMAEEIHTTIGGITRTYMEDLELPEILINTAQTAEPVDENPIQDSGSPDEAVTSGGLAVVTTSPAIEAVINEPDASGEITEIEWEESTVTVGEMPPIAAHESVTLMADTTYDIWVGGVQVTDSNKDNITGSDIAETVSYDPGTNTLTLDNATINNGYSTTIDDRNAQYGIYSTLNALKLVVVGTNTITCPNASVNDSYAIYTTGTLEISGSDSDSLTATGGTARDISAGVYVTDALTIESGILNATGGTATYLGAKSYGLYADSLIIKSGSLTAAGGAVTNQSGTSYGACAIHNLNIEGGSLNATGGTASGTFGTSYGAYLDNRSSTDSTGSVRVSGSGSLIAIGGNTSGEICTSAGVYLNNASSTDSTGSVRVSGRGSLIATGGNTRSTSSTSTGVYINNISSNGSTGSVSVSEDGNLTATGGNTSRTSTGVYINNISSNGSTGSVSVSEDGNLTATGGVANETFAESYGVYLNNSSSTDSTGSVSISGSGELLATGDAASGSQGKSAGVYLDNSSSTDSVSVSDGGSLNATGDAASSSYGVYANGSVSIFDGMITAQSGAASNTSAGVHSVSMNVEGGIVTATGGTASGTNGTSAGVYAGSVSVLGSGELTATGDEASGFVGKSAGVYFQPSGSMNVSGGTVEVTGGTVSGTFGKSGGVYFQSSGSVTVSGGTLTAQSHAAETSQAMNIIPLDLFNYTSGSSIMVGDASPGTEWDNSTALTSYKYVQLVVVPVAPAYTITADPTSKDFGSLAEGYSAPEAQSVTITNTGNSSVTLTQPTSTNYTIGALSDTTLAPNGTATFTVAPKSDLAVGNHNETLTISTDHSTNATVELSFFVTADPNPTCLVTFNPNGGTVSETSRSIASGTAVGNLPTPTRSGSYIFEGWYTSANGGTKISASTTVEANLTCYAHWTYTGGGGSGSSNESSSNDNSSPVIVIPPPPDKPNSPTQGEIRVTGTVDSKGNVTVSITDKNVTDAFDKALADAKKNGNEKNGITVVLRIDNGSRTGSNVTVNLPKTVQDTIIAKKIVNTVVLVDNPEIRVGMDLATVKEINKQAKSDVNITATRTDSAKLTGDAKNAIGSRPVFDLNVNYGNGMAISSFGTGSVSVSIQYTLGANEKAENVQAVYVDEKGKVHWLTNSFYDIVEQVLRFDTSHFSTYGIGYKQMSTEFTDIENHWAKEDIDFVVSRGLLSGTSETKFSPNAAMTRGMFVTALGRLANADVSSYAKSSFNDVKSDAYYMGYIEWASKNDIVSGVGNNKFAPEQSITREQMAAVISNYAKTIGYILPKVHAENTFADNGTISTYARESVTKMQMAGVISGKNDNQFDPQNTSTRAEVSAVMRRFVELANL